MYKLVLFLAAVALLCPERQCANVARHMKLFEIENDLKPDNSSSKESGVKRFLNMGKKPLPSYTHGDTPLPITCEATGTPAPTIRWFKNDAPIYEHDSESNEVVETDPESLGRISSTLLVTNSKVSKTNVYTCLAASGNKVLRASTIVHSLASSDPSEHMKVSGLSPRVTAWYRALVAPLGRAASLPCAARGPRAWTDNTGRPATHNPRMKILRSGTLVISPLLWSDMGEYTCTVHNAFGKASATTFLYPAAP